jgi:hypothetical protein
LNIILAACEKRSRELGVATSRRTLEVRRKVCNSEPLIILTVLAWQMINFRSATQFRDGIVARAPIMISRNSSLGDIGHGPFCSAAAISAISNCGLEKLKRPPKFLEGRLQPSDKLPGNYCFGGLDACSTDWLAMFPFPDTQFCIRLINSSFDLGWQLRTLFL